MRHVRLRPTGATVQAGAELVDSFAGARTAGALLAPLGAVSAGGPLQLVANPRIVGGHGFKAWECTGTQMAYAKMRRPLVLGTDQWISIVVVFRKRTSSIDANVIMGFGSDSGSAGNTLMYMRGHTSNANALEFYIQDSAGATYTVAATSTSGLVQLSDMRWHTAVMCTSLYQINGSESLRRFYVDGVFEGEGTAASAALAATTFQHMCATGVVRTTASASAGAFDVALVAPLFGRLDHADMRSLSLDPWQLFKTQKHRPILRQAEGGTGPQDYTGSGTIVFSGTATTQHVSHTHNYTGTGTLTFSGSAGVTVTDVDPGGPTGSEMIVQNGMWVTALNEERLRFYNGSYYGGGIASGSGDLIIFKYTPATADTQRVVLQAAFEYDDHDNPSIFILPDGRIAVAYCKHTVGRPQVQVSTNPEDITAWGPVVYAYWTNGAYACIFQLGSYYWVAFQPTSGRQDAAARTSDFTSFGSAFFWLVSTDINTYTPYFTIAQNGPNRIDVSYVTGHPGQGDQHADLYHIYFTESGGAMIPHKSDGTVLTLPVTTTQGTLVFDSGTTTNCVMCQCRIDTNGYPCVLFVRFETINDHRGMFARWTGSAWTTPVEVCAMGQGIAPGFEPYYAGLMSFDGNTVDRVYVSVKVGSFHEIQQFDTTDDGATWAKTQDVTTGSAVKNFRPFSALGHDGIKAFWLSGTYVDYTDFYTDIWAIGATAGTALQYARPEADITTGAWTTNATGPNPTLFGALDETSEDDADYISCSAVGSMCEVRLSDLTDPLTGNGHVIRYRARAPNGGVVLVQLTDKSQSRVNFYRYQTLTPLFATYEFTLTADEANQIVDYTALVLRFSPLGVAPLEG